MNLLELINKESSNNSALYLYEEDGKWFANERVEVDLDQLLITNWFVALCSDTEIMLIKTE